MVELFGVGRMPRTIFEGASLEPARRHHHSVWNTDQFDIGQHDARAKAAVVKHGIQTGCI